MKLSMYRCDVYIGRIWIKLDWDCGAMLDALDSGGMEMEMGKWRKTGTHLSHRKYDFNEQLRTLSNFPK